MSPLIHGGQQQQDRRSGSEDVAGAVALAAALSEASADPEKRMPTSGTLTTKRLLPAFNKPCQMSDGLPKKTRTCLSNTCSLVHPGLHSDPLVMRLDMAGIAVSRGFCLHGRA